MKWFVGSLLGLALVVVATDVVEQRALARRAEVVADFERHVVLGSSRASMSKLCEVLGEADARRALSAAASRLVQLGHDGGDRVCLWGTKSVIRKRGHSSATLQLFDLSTAAGWQRPSLWLPTDPGADLDALRFVADRLVVDWNDHDGQARQAAITWVPGSLPGPGTLE